MNLAIISDIHGNIHALEAVLRDIEARGVEQIIVNGDMVNRGPHNIAVLERITALDVPLVMGNHDDLMRKWVERDPDIPAEWFGDPFWEGTAWAARQLAEAGWIDALRDLPMTYRIEADSAPTLLISHGSPRHYREGYGRYLKEEQVSEIVQMYPHDVLIGSHTHRPMVLHWGEHTLLNTGAVGAPFNSDPRAQYLLLTLAEAGWQWEFCAVPYDRAAALADYERSGYLAEGELSAHIFWQELHYALPLHAPFWMWTEKQELPRDWSTWQRFTDTFADKLILPDPFPSGPLEPDRPWAD